MYVRPVSCVSTQLKNEVRLTKVQIQLNKLRENYNPAWELLEGGPISSSFAIQKWESLLLLVVYVCPVLSWLVYLSGGVQVQYCSVSIVFNIIPPRQAFREREIQEMKEKTEDDNMMTVKWTGKYGIYNIESFW
jgi:hypothetical protein